MSTLSTRGAKPTYVVGLACLWAIVAFAGCSGWPLVEKDRTTFITPGMRVAAIRELGARAEKADSQEQIDLSQQLAAQIRTEPDPIVRKAIQESISEFPTPLARQVLIAGLQDQDMDVRVACCERLGGRADETVVGALRTALEQDNELDVRLAAIDALGRLPSTETVAALAVALNDRDPAMQYAAVEAMKAVSGQDLGNDVAVWREYAASGRPEISVASKPKGWMPF